MNLTRRSAVGVLIAGFASSALAAQDRRALRVANLTDMHVMPERRAAEGFAKALSGCQEHNPDLILLGGDAIMDGYFVLRERTLQQWSIFNRELKAGTSLRVEAALGNHDIWGWGKASLYGNQLDYGKKLALDQLGLESSYRSFDVGSWHFIVLDSMIETHDGQYVSKLDEEQFSWLADDLAQSRGRPTLITSHIPILSVGSLMFQQAEKTGRWTINQALMHIDARRLKELFIKHPNVKVCLAGHTHLVDRVEYLGVAYINTGAVCGAWWQGKFQETSNGYSILDLFDNGAFTYRYFEFPWREK